MVPPPFTTDHTTEVGMTLPFASRPVTANCCVLKENRLAGFGVTVSVASTGVTLTVASPAIVPLAARTVLVNVPAIVPAVKRPDAASMLPPPFTTDQAGVMATTLPPASLPTAVNCCAALVATDAGFGVTLIEASGPAVTVTVAVPAMVPTLKSPDVGLIAPPPATIDQEGVIATTLPAASLPTAVNCWVALIAIGPGCGVRGMLASGPA